MTSFSDLGLAAPLLKALAAEGYETPTPIQAQAIPSVLTGRDLLGVAQTGTGKTAAFALPILQRLDADKRPTPRKGCRCLVLSPTRELASQIAESFRVYGRHMQLSVAVVFGGVNMNRQIREMSVGVDVLVATPGRLLDLLNQRALGLSNVEILVLDEADQMLDMGFIHDIRKLAALIPAKRQTLFFSATMPKEIAELADRFLKDPVKVAVTPIATTAERVDQHVVFVDTPRKQALLHAMVAKHEMKRALVFTRTKHGADRVVRRLVDAGIPAAAIHGNKSQPQRERALAEFKAGRLHLLVATDIAARGIDIDSVSHVVNYDLPNVPESYVHRIGRTARAGAEGMAISFCDREERAYLRDIERLTRQKVPVMEAPDGLADLPEAPREPRPQQQPRQGQRPGGQRPGGQRAQAPRGGQAPRSGQPGDRPAQPHRGAQGQARPQGQADKGRRAEEATPSRWHSGVSNPAQTPADARPRRRDNRFGSR